MSRLEVAVLFLACFCNADETRCSRYHYEEQTLAKIVRLEHRLEQLEARTTAGGLTTNPLCPDSWIRFQDSCYLFPRGSVTFDDAEFLCVQYSSYLVHIESKTENVFLKNHMMSLKDSNYWTGLQKNSSGKWMWYGTQKEASFTDWSSHSPNNSGGVQDCVFLELKFNFQWNDIHCSSKFQAICERKIGCV